MRRRAGAAVVLLLLAGGATRRARADDPLPPPVTLPPELARVLTDYETAWRAHDARVLARLFAEDGFALSPSSPPARGRAAIERHYANAGGDLSLRAYAYAVDGRIGYIVGGFGRTGEPEGGKFTLTLVKGGDGRWLIFSDMDNGNERRN